MFEQEFSQVKQALDAAQNIALISHKGPDGDTVGSNLALRSALKAMGKNAVSFAKDPIPMSLQFLHGTENFYSELNPNEFDLFIAIDCGADYMMKFDEVDFSNKNLINIDHHPSNERFGTINVVNDKAAATACIIYFLIEYLGVQITRDIATYLLTGLYTDTGSFRHSNTTP